MDIEQVREIAEVAFKARFPGIGISGESSPPPRLALAAAR